MFATLTADAQVPTHHRFVFIHFKTNAAIKLSATLYGH